MHPSLLRGAPALLVVAIQATGDDVIPGLASAFNDRHHMVKSEVLGGAFLAAILAGVVISRVNVCPAEFYVLKALPYFHILEKSHDARHFDRETDAVNLAIVLRQHLNLSLEKEG
jgi:hypothetical protein